MLVLTHLYVTLTICDGTQSEGLIFERVFCFALNCRLDNSTIELLYQITYDTRASAHKSWTHLNDVFFDLSLSIYFHLRNVESSMDCPAEVILSVWCNSVTGWTYVFFASVTCWVDTLWQALSLGQWSFFNHNWITLASAPSTWFLGDSSSHTWPYAGQLNSIPGFWVMEL